jgi:hypothetical protein
VLLGSNNTLNISRASLGAPIGLNLRETGFRGSAVLPEYNNTLSVLLWANPLRTNRVAATPKGMAMFRTYRNIYRKSRVLNDFFAPN